MNGFTKLLSSINPVERCLASFYNRSPADLEDPISLLISINLVLILDEAGQLLSILNPVMIADVDITGYRLPIHGQANQ